jgi:hypothetical protein
MDKESILGPQRTLLTVDNPWRSLHSPNPVPATEERWSDRATTVSSGNPREPVVLWKSPAISAGARALRLSRADG